VLLIFVEAVEVRRHCVVTVRWKFAYTCVLEKMVRRRRRMWSWQRMKTHRQLCVRYKDLYKNKLLSTKLSADQQADIEVLWHWVADLLCHAAGWEMCCSLRRAWYKWKDHHSWFGWWHCAGW